MSANNGVSETPLQSAELPISEWDVGSIYGKWTFSVANRMLGAGLKKPLVFEDLMNISDRDKSSYLLKQLKDSYSTSVSMFGIPRLLIALLKTQKDVVFRSMMCALLEGAVRVSGPVILGLLLKALTSDSPNVAFAYALCLGFANLTQTIVHHILFLHTMRLGWNWRASATVFVYDRLFAMNGSSNGGDSSDNPSTGKLVNLISTDALRFEQFTTFANFFWTSIVEMIAIFVLLAMKLGALPAAAGVGVTLLCIPFQLMISRKYSRIRGQTASMTDERVRHVSEVIDGISTVKSYNWEMPFYELISTFRLKEMSNIRSAQFIQAIFQGLYYAATPLASFCTFSVYWAMGNELTLPIVFSTLSFLQVLRHSMGRQWTISLERTSDMYPSCVRIDAFLAMTDAPGEKETTKKLSSDHTSLNISDIELQSKSNLAQDEGIGDKSILYSVDTPTSYFYSLNLSDAADANTVNAADMCTIKNIHFAVAKGELVMVVGAVGCGKSTLLLSVLNEVQSLDSNQESVSCTGQTHPLPIATCINSSFAYCAQRPWIVASTVKENVIMSRGEQHADFNAEMYADALESSCVVEDLDAWVAYDQTEIGERGISVSGGQKARIALARAVYADKDLYLLDDPLSAVDAHVGKALFFNCIIDKLIKRNKGVLLVTHQLQYLPYAHKILLLSESGEQMYFGTYADLLSRAAEFPHLGLTSFDAGCDTGPTKQRVFDASYVPKSFDAELANRVDKQYNRMSEHDSADQKRLIISVEDKATGSIHESVYWRYLVAGGLFDGLVALFMAVVAQLLLMTTDYWLKWWTTETYWSDQDAIAYVWIYAILVASCIAMGFTRATLWFRFTRRASCSLHDSALWGVMRSPMSFFIANPTGRILNRFSTDQQLVDDLLATVSFDFAQTILFCIAGMILACVAVPFVVLVLPFLAGMFYVVRKKYVTSALEIKRFVATTKSPIYANFSASLDGLITLRAFKLRDYVTKQFHMLNDRNGRAWWSFLMASRWVGFRLDLISASMVMSTAVLSVWLRDSVDIGILGFALVYVISLSGMFQLSVRFSAELEAQMTSVERLNDYSVLSPEDGYCCSNYFLQNTLSRAGTSKSSTLGNASPFRRGRANSTGSVNSVSKILHFVHRDRAFRMNEILNDINTQVSNINANHKHTILKLDSLSVSYRVDLEPVLKDFNLEVPAGFKVGICGRTGCGKSSLLLALLRLNLITHGDIKLALKYQSNDPNNAPDQCAHSLSLLHDLDIETCRSLISVIPQDPHLFSGTVRSNLDPFNIYSDDDIWKALEDAHIRDHIQNSNEGLGLLSVVEEQGKNFSVGQRQLLSLSRAILRKCKYILMDEVSASVDFVTDRLIQETIRTSPILKEATILTIAHRLRTIADSDMVVVINNGKVAESAHPYVLLQEDSLFRQLVEQSNAYSDIYDIAETYYNSKSAK